MQAARVVVQRCGCIALPEEFAERLGIVPEAILSAELDEQRRAVLLRLAEPAPPDADLTLAACSVNP